ncbi:MAG TPA: hypothetical protein VJ723_09735 [Candidatus Angelobacter sp.]|nr:hypothetical protein [Candidatus Angelobacter sp.]
MSKEIDNVSPTNSMGFETLTVGKKGAVVLVEITAPPVNLLVPELVRDLVSLIQRVPRHFPRRENTCLRPS